MVKQQGFTLIELLITMVVLSLGLMGLVGLQVQMIRGNSFNRDMTIATSIGADLLEQAKAVGSLDLINLVNNFGQPTPVVYGDVNGDLLLDPGFLDVDNDGSPPYNGRFRWTRTFNADPSGNGNFDTVNVSVFWPDTVTHRLNFTTVVNER